jgi:SpoIIAA-like
MLEPLSDLPAGVLGFEARGRIEAADYEQVLVPAVDRELADGHEIRIVLVFPTFEGLTPSAAWQDMKMGVEHLTRWRRIALVTDVEWMIHLTHLFGWMTPGELRHVPLAERDAAVAWAAAAD